MDFFQSFWEEVEKNGKIQFSLEIFGKDGSFLEFLEIFWKRVKNFTFSIDFLEKHDILLKYYKILERGIKNWKIHKNL